MAKSSLDDSAQAENPHCSRSIASDHLAGGAALLRAAPDDVFILCNPSLIHEYLWARFVCIEHAEARLYLGRKAKRETMRCAK
jgi:hypothetical protein